MIFQNPLGALNPFFSSADVLAEALRFSGKKSPMLRLMGGLPKLACNPFTAIVCPISFRVGSVSASSLPGPVHGAGSDRL